MKLLVTDKSENVYDLDDILVEFANLIGSCMVRLQRIEEELNMNIETASPENDAELTATDIEVSE